jgi:hypothetical protein
MVGFHPGGAERSKSQGMAKACAAAEKRKVVWKRGGVIPEKEKDPIIRYAQKTPRNSTRNTLKKDSAFIHSRKLILNQRTLKFFKCAGGGRCE